MMIQPQYFRISNIDCKLSKIGANVIFLWFKESLRGNSHQDLFGIRLNSCHSKRILQIERLVSFLHCRSPSGAPGSVPPHPPPQQPPPTQDYSSVEMLQHFFGWYKTHSHLLNKVQLRNTAGIREEAEFFWIEGETGDSFWIELVGWMGTTVWTLSRPHRHSRFSLLYAHYVHTALFFLPRTPCFVCMAYFSLRKVLCDKVLIYFFFSLFLLPDLLPGFAVDRPTTVSEDRNRRFIVTKFHALDNIWCLSVRAAQGCDGRDLTVKIVCRRLFVNMSHVYDSLVSRTCVHVFASTAMPV